VNAPPHALLAVLTLLSACERDHRLSTVQQPPDIMLTGVRLREYRGGGTSATATTPSLGFHREGTLAGHVTATDVVVDSAAGLHVEAKTVQGDALGGLIEGLQVHALTSRGTTIDSPRAFFDRNLGASGTASTDAGLIVRHPSFVLEGQSGTVDIAEERAQVSAVSTRLK
jgi:hypothetical protein